MKAGRTPPEGTTADTTISPRCCRLAPFHTYCPQRARRYPRDLTDAQCAVIETLLPDPAFLGGSGGRPESWCRRIIVDAIFHVVDNGIKWRAMADDFPSNATVFKYFATGERTGATTGVLDALRDRIRLQDGRAAEPTAAVIDLARGRVLSITLLGIDADSVLDYGSGCAVAVGELFDQIGDVLGHTHPQLHRGFPTGPATLGPEHLGFLVRSRLRRRRRHL